MFGFDIIYLLNTDQREAAAAFVSMYNKARLNMFITILINVVIEVFVLMIILVLITPGVHISIASVVITGINIIREMISVELMTAIRMRSNVLIYIVEQIMYALLSHILPFKLGINQSRLKRSIIADYERRFRKYNQTWERLDQRFKKYDDHDIDNYWKSLGLSNKKINKTSKCVTFKATTPIVPVEQDKECFDMRHKLRPNSLIRNISKEWVQASMTDAMHVRSIYKRICGPKTGGEPASMIAMKSLLERKTTLLTYTKVADIDKIMIALGTSGSAGQFAKRSDYEDIWKNKTSIDAIELWKQITSLTIDLVYLTNSIDSRLVQYMLYRKQEAITLDEDGKQKPTRVMNAPNLVARVTDCLTFYEYNEAIVNSRFTDMPSLGMNIFLELKMNLIYDPSMSYIVSDFSDYDGTQHPAQGFAVCGSRIKFMIENKIDLKKIAYLPARYEAHMNRTVKSTSGIEYNVLGQQASGDFTTADDNTQKAVYFLTSIIEKMHELHIIRSVHTDVNKMIKNHDIGVDVTSDDTGLMCRLKTKDLQLIEGIYHDEASKLGWSIKKGSFSITSMTQQGCNEYLSHSVHRRNYFNRDSKVTISMAVLVRPRERAIAKAMIASEISADIGRQSRAKLASKYLSLIMTSLGMPELIMLGILGLLTIRAASSDYKGSYSWMGITAKTIGDLDFNTMFTLQSGCTIGIRIDWMEITSKEKQLLDDIFIDVKQLILNDDQFNSYVKHKVTDLLIVKPIGKYFIWNVRAAIKCLENAYKQLDASSYICKPASTQPWWNLNEPSIAVSNVGNKDIGTVMACKHSPKIKVMNVCKYKVMIKCKECFEKDIEQRYQGISIKIDIAKDYSSEEDETKERTVYRDKELNK